MACCLLLALLYLALSPLLLSSPRKAVGRTPSTFVQPTHPPHHQSDVTYHGGPVQLAPSSYLIFWGAGWISDATLKVTRQRVESYFQHVGGTAYENVLTQYSMQNANGSRSFIANETRFAANQVWVDPVNPPADSHACSGMTVSDQAAKQEIAHALAVTHWVRDDQNVTYFVYTPPFYSSYEPGWGCSGKDYCADHEWSPDMPGMHVAYAVMPYPAEPRCVGASASSEMRDAALINATAHEQFESITDPTPGRAGDTSFKNQGWFYVDAHKNVLEIGDLCVRDKKLRNLHGLSFNLQSMWSNRDGGCI